MIFPLGIKPVKTGRLVDWRRLVDLGLGELVDLGLVDLILVDWGNWRNSWGIDWRLAQEVGRRGELVHLLEFLATTCMA